jgi:hypothetical protein
MSAKLLMAGAASGAITAAEQVMQADTVPHFDVRCLGTSRYYFAGNFVAQGQGQRLHRRFSGPIMHIGMADTGGSDANKDICIPHLRFCDLLQLQGLVGGDHTDGFHTINPFGRFWTLDRSRYGYWFFSRLIGEQDSRVQGAKWE